MPKPDKTIVIYGSGLAAMMTAIALANGLSDAYRIVLANDSAETSADIFYGSVTAPGGYDFYRSLGLDEPILFMNSATSFSFGTQYKNWPSRTGDWAQCHHQPLPLLAGVPLQHHLARNAVDLQPLLISAMAMQSGKFAHPPEDASIPLSRAEYGYQFSVQEWTKLLTEIVEAGRVEMLSGSVENVESSEGKIAGFHLGAGETIEADLYVDCSGPARHCLRALAEDFHVTRSLSASYSRQAATQLGPPAREVQAVPTGWVSRTFLQDAITTLDISHSDADGSFVDDFHCALGRVKSAWVGNCVAIGHAAGVVEPLTPAPMMLLQRDIERLLELVPVSADMTAERREFNRRFDDDFTHAEMFANAFFANDKHTPSAYWDEATSNAQTEPLQRKIAQFESRGLLVKYDLEPFNDEDWTILHNGMGRQAARYDLQVERIAKPDVQKQLSGMKQAVEQLVTRMPPHHLYVANMKSYLERQRNV